MQFRIVFVNNVVYPRPRVSISDTRKFHMCFCEKNLNNRNLCIEIMKYRSRTEIVSQILEAAADGASKTKIMYKGFLSYAQLKDYPEVC